MLIKSREGKAQPAAAAPSPVQDQQAGGSGAAAAPASAQIPLQRDLSGTVICLDPARSSNQNNETETVGPGSASTVAMGPPGIKGANPPINDYQVTLGIATDLQKLLTAQGADVVLTRTGDAYYGGGRDRARVANQAGADLLLVIDVSASDDATRQGVSTAAPALVYGWTDDIYGKSNTAAFTIQSCLVRDLGALNQGVNERSDYPEFNWSNVPAVQAQVGFLTNPDEDTKLGSPDYQQKVAAALLDGIDLYFSKK